MERTGDSATQLSVFLRSLDIVLPFRDGLTANRTAPPHPRAAAAARGD